MTKNDFIEEFPDICCQHITMDKIYSRKELDQAVLNVTQLMNTGLVYYQHSGKKVTIFTSVYFKKRLDKLIAGAKVMTRDGRVAIIESEKPYLVCGSLTVRATVGIETDVYDCSFFKED